jgi:DNA-binding beta-propeller fold protein YncE
MRTRVLVAAVLVVLACLGIGSAPARAATSPPKIRVAFGVGVLPLNGSTSLSFVISNPNQSVGVTGVAFTDNLPAGLVVATPNGLDNECGGTLIASAGSSSVSLSGATLSAGTVCLISLNVVGIWGGYKTNSVTITSDAGSGDEAFAFLTVTTPPGDRVYWSSGAPISYDSLDDTAGGDLPTGNTAPEESGGTAIDPAAGRIYWAYSGANKISYANLDGSGVSDLNTSGATVDQLSGVAIDPAAGRIYWASTHGQTISYANLNGSGGHDLNTSGATVNFPIGVAVDPTAGRIYWANEGANTISYANLGGSGGGHDLNTSGATVNGPEGVAIDPANGRIYWANGFTNTISYANLDGSGGQDLSIAGGAVNNPVGVAIDPAAGRVYWGNTGTGRVSYAGVDGGIGHDLSSIYPAGGDGFPALLKAPGGTGAPAATGGTTIGSTLSCSQGSWAADVLEAFLYQAPQSFAYHWARNGTDISGATMSSLMTSAPGSYTCRVTASNFAGSAQQTSAAHVVLATLNVSKQGAGSGTVTSSPAGINCGGTCSAQFGEGTMVMLTATAAAGSTFTGWSSDCTGMATCTVMMSTDHSATATFTKVCIVPKVKGKKLAKAKKLIRTAGCSVGKVRRIFSNTVKRGRVIAQRPKPGVQRPLGAKVRLKVSKGKR